MYPSADMASPLRLALLLTIVCAARAGPHYTAAVYEHRLLGEEDGGVKANMGNYVRAANVAKQQGADIILYPEYGLFPPSNNRSQIREYLEVVPDPRQTTANPCEEAELFADRPILRNLSCVAKKNGIVVVANMGGLEPCSEDDRGCPADGAFQYNTNVVFDRNGTLFKRYYKEHLFYELSLDLPTEEQDPVFETDFGKFAIFICFDMMFEKMAATSRLWEVDAVLISAMWPTSLPFYATTQWFQAWAMGNDATLLASNIQVPGHALSGSGIFRGRRGSAIHTQNPDGMSKLLVATLPKFNQDIPSRTQLTAIFENGTGEVREDGTDISRVCSFGILGETKDLHNEFRCFHEDVANYTLVKLNGTKGRVEACHNGMCCELLYTATSMDESFYLGVSNATNNSSLRYMWAEENCFLVRCDDFGGKLCSHFPTRSETLFLQVTLTANFTTDYVYPSFVSNAMRLLPAHDWTFGWKYDTRSIEMTNSRGVHLIGATLKGRPFQRDPPSIR